MFLNHPSIHPSWTAPHIIIILLPFDTGHHCGGAWLSCADDDCTTQKRFSRKDLFQDRNRTGRRMTPLRPYNLSPSAFVWIESECGGIILLLSSRHHSLTFYHQSWLWRPRRRLRSMNKCAPILWVSVQRWKWIRVIKMFPDVDDDEEVLVNRSDASKRPY